MKHVWIVAVLAVVVGGCATIQPPPSYLCMGVAPGMLYCEPFQPETPVTPDPAKLPRHEMRSAQEG